MVVCADRDVVVCFCAIAAGMAEEAIQSKRAGTNSPGRLAAQAGDVSGGGVYDRM